MKISIITPSFGQLDWLKLSVASVADQVSVSDLSTNGLSVEHIIQDGGSPGFEQFVLEMGEELQSRYGGDFVLDLQPYELLHFRSRSGYTLRIFKEPDLGMYDAINKGIARSNGELWAWLNCDEQYLPGTIQYVSQWFENNPEAEILCGDALLTDAEGNALSYRRIIAPTWYHTRLVHLSSLSCASFYRRSVVERAGGFDIAWRSIGDAEWMARVLKAGCRIRTCGKPLSTFAFTGQNTSESPLAVQEGQRWREGADAPARWMEKPVVLLHRLRKMLGGAYGHRNLEFAIHQQGGNGRVTKYAAKVGWKWPGSSPDVRTEIPILGTRLSVTTYADLGRQLLEAVRGEKSLLAVDFANTHVITLRRHDPKFEALTKSMDLVVPDGMPLVWVMNAKGACLKDRVYGPTFTRNFLRDCPSGLTHYLVGGSDECGRRFRERMLTLNPTLNFLGGYHGMASPDGVLDDDDAVLKEIRKLRPDFIWVGLGTPKQYGWIHQIKPKLDHGVLLAVGFAFDVNAGMKPDAPAWMQSAGLGWLHRMASEPRRLVGRYLKWNTLFLFYLIEQKIKKCRCAKS